MKRLFSLYFAVLTTAAVCLVQANAANVKYSAFDYSAKYETAYGANVHSIQNGGNSSGSYTRNYSISVYQYTDGVDRTYQSFGRSTALTDSTTFTTLHTASLVVRPYEGFAASGVDFSIDVVSADGTSTGANIYEKTDASTGTTYVAGSEGHLASTGMVGFTAGEMVALTASYFDSGGQLVTDTLTSAELAVMADNSKTYDVSDKPENFLNGKTGWYTRLLYGANYNYRDVFFVKDGVIVASFEALPEVTVAAAGNQISGQPLPGVLASLAALGLIGGIAKRRKAKVERE